jgi:Transposase DDE domain group 1
VYTRLYCGRGDMENRLKELQQGLAMDRTSCTRFAANQLRLLFSVAAYVLFQALQTVGRTTGLGAAQVWTVRERLVKIAVWSNARCGASCCTCLAPSRGATCGAPSPRR